jgi:hypothetical protein
MSTNNSTSHTTSNANQPWSPTHRVTIASSPSLSQQSLLIMRTSDGCGHSRFEWTQSLPPSFRQDPQGSWRYIGWSETDAPLAGARIDVQPLDSASPSASPIIPGSPGNDYSHAA